MLKHSAAITASKKLLSQQRTQLSHHEHHLPEDTLTSLGTRDDGREAQPNGTSSSTVQPSCYAILPLTHRGDTRSCQLMKQLYIKS